MTLKGEGSNFTAGSLLYSYDLTQNDQIWHGNTSDGAACSQGVSTHHYKIFVTLTYGPTSKLFDLSDQIWYDEVGK